jgi:hypothetical protein
MLHDDEIERFVADGFVSVRQAVLRHVLSECRAQLNLELREAGVDVEDPTTWVEPVVRFWYRRLHQPEPSRSCGGSMTNCWDLDVMLSDGR